MSGMIRTIALFVTLVGAISADATEGRNHDLSDSAPLPLVRGVNRIPDFDGKGHQAEIVYAWRDNMNAHGYGIYSVLMPQPNSADDWALVTFESRRDGQRNSEEALRDQPFDDEQSVASVRFIKARWKGKAETLAISARRDLSNAVSFIDAAPVDFTIYRLTANSEETIGWPFYYFDQIERFRSRDLFCNSDWALTAVLDLPLPRDYRGPRTPTGCIP